MSDEDRDALMSAYLRGYNAMLRNQTDISWGASLSEKQVLLRGSEHIPPQDRSSYVALMLFRQAFLDGKNSDRFNGQLEFRTYGKNRKKSVGFSLDFDMVSPKVLENRALQFWYPMAREALEDYKGPESVALPEKFELPNGFLADIWERIKHNPREASLPTVTQGSAREAAPIEMAQESSALKEAVEMITGGHEIPRTMIGVPALGSCDGAAVPRRHTDHLSASLSPKQVFVQRPDDCEQVLLEHERYRTASVKDPQKAFTMIKSGQSVTYLPEFHGGNGPGSVPHVQNLVNALLASGEPVFLETSDRYNELPNARKNLEKYWRELLTPSGAPMDGIMATLLQQPSLNYSLLKELESGPMPSELLQYRKLEIAMERAKGQIFVALQEQLPLSFRSAGTARSAVQARVIAHETQTGHSWAIGGSLHAEEVKQGLKQDGWEEMIPEWQKLSDRVAITNQSSKDWSASQKGRNK